MKENNIRFSQNFDIDLATILESKNYDKFFLLTDSKVYDIYGKFIEDVLKSYNVKTIVIPEGDDNKSLDSVTRIWQFLMENGASRHSCIVNFGGGMITDLGGFAASTFKRGIDFVNIPTTLLAMVDASAGGKTGINFQNLKNEIGVFSNAVSVIIHCGFIRSLDHSQILSGYAEMLKHSLIDSEEMWAKIIIFNFEDFTSPVFFDIIKESVQVKERIVNEDPHEGGKRKILNLGHTFGHAFETLSHRQNKPIPHGYAVAYGLICELYLSCIKLSFPTDKMRKTVNFIHENYGCPQITCNDYDELLEIMTHDKKNNNDIINFALLNDFGKPALDIHATKDEIFEAFDFLREAF